MLIFLFGPDSYSRQQKVREYVARYRAKYTGMSLRTFSLADPEELSAWRDFLNAQSLFEQSRLGIVSDLDELPKQDQKEVIGLLKQQLDSKDITLIITQDKKPTKDFSFLLKAPAIPHEFEALTGVQFQQFLKTEAEKRGMKFDLESQYLLMQVYNGDNWGLVTFLDKLEFLPKKEFSKKLITPHIDADVPLNVFSSAQTLRESKDVGTRLATLEELLSGHEEPAMIFNMCAVSPYASNGWKEAMADYDVAIKSGKLEYEEVLLDIALH